jgi:hypothetical protein
MSDLHVAFGEHPPGTKLPNTRVVVHGELVAVDAVTARLVFLKLCSPSERDKSAGGEVAVLLKDRDGYLTREEIEELRALLEERLASGAAPLLDVVGWVERITEPPVESGAVRPQVVLLHAVTVQERSAERVWGGVPGPSQLARGGGTGQVARGALPAALLGVLGSGEGSLLGPDEPRGGGAAREAGRAKAAGGHWRKRQNQDRGSRLVSFLVEWLGAPLRLPACIPACIPAGVVPRRPARLSGRRRRRRRAGSAAAGRGGAGRRGGLRTGVI